MGTGWWVADYLHASPALLVSWIVWVIGSIVLHELAHGWAALAEGDSTPRDLGHMTWNPLVHMGGMSLAIFALVGIAWGMMPVSPGRFRSEHAEAKVALAGPMMNLALALIAIVLGGIWLNYFGWVGFGVWDAGLTFFAAGAFLNIILAVFNLVPVPPLDGSTILADFVPAYRELRANPRFAMVSFLILLFVFFSMSDAIVAPARDASHAGIRTVASVLPGGAARPASTPTQPTSTANLDWLNQSFSDEGLAETLGATPSQIRRIRDGTMGPEEADELVRRLSPPLDAP